MTQRLGSSTYVYVKGFIDFDFDVTSTGEHLQIALTNHYCMAGLDRQPLFCRIRH